MCTNASYKDRASRVENTIRLPFPGDENQNPMDNDDEVAFGNHMRNVQAIVTVSDMVHQDYLDKVGYKLLKMQHVVNLESKIGKINEVVLDNKEKEMEGNSSIKQSLENCLYELERSFSQEKIKEVFEEKNAWKELPAVMYFMSPSQQNDLLEYARLSNE